MADKARFAYGSKARVATAIESGAINAYDFLCLSGENERPSVGWVDSQGNPVYVECVKYVEVVSALPETGEEDIIYLLEGKGYVWYGDTFVPMAESTDVTTLETQVTELTTQMETKVDATTVQNMIEEHYDAAVEVVEF